MDNSLKSKGMGNLGEQIERLTRITSAPIVGEFRGVPVAVDDEGVVTRRDDLLLRPLLRNETVRIKSVDSFIDYVNKHVTDNVTSAMFVDEDNAMFGVVFDYEDKQGVLNQEHAVTLKLEESLAMQTWKKMNGKGMTQEDFALFIEANIGDIVDPAPAKMVELSTELRAKKDVHFESKVSLHDGATTFKYSEEVKGTTANGQMEVPKEFKVGFVLFRGQTEGYKITCKFRYRVGQDGKLVLWYSIPDLDRIRETAFADVKKQVAAGLTGNVPAIYDAIVPVS